MKKNMKTAFLFFGLTLALASCGRDDTTQQLQFNTRPAFQVSSVFPELNATQVDRDQAIQLTLNQPVNSATALGNITLFEQIGNASTNITSEAQVSVSSNTLTVTLNRQYLADAGYKLSVTPGLKSTSGEALRALSVFTFYTGINRNILSGGNVDTTSPPKVISVTLQRECFYRAYLVRFNEDLVSAPQVDYKISTLGIGALTLSSGTAITYAADSLSSWIVDFGVDQAYENAGLEFKIDIQGSTVIDFEGNQMSSNYSTKKTNSILTGC